MSDDNESPKIFILREQKRGHDGKFYFEQHSKQEAYSYYLSGVTQDSSVVGVVPTGKKFHCKTIIYHNVQSVPVEVRLTNGSGVSYTKMMFMAGSYASKEITNIEGLVFDDDPYWVLNTFATGSNIFLGGELDPDEDAS